MSAAQVSAPCLWADCQRPPPSAAATCRGRAPRPFPIPSAPGTARVSSLNLAGPKGPASFDDDDSHPDLRAGCDGKAGFSYDLARAVARQEDFALTRTPPKEEGDLLLRSIPSGVAKA